jgi:hypothetical protein
MSFSRRIALAASLAVCLLAACSREPESASAPEPAPTPSDRPEVPLETPGPAPTTTVEPAPLAVGSRPASFEGFGPAGFGSNEENVRIAWGRPLQAGTPMPGSTCYQLFMDPPPGDGRGIRFMFEDGRFVRYEVTTAAIEAPGGLKVGEPVTRVAEVHAGRVVEQPHKYLPGARDLVVSPADGGAARLVVEVDVDSRISGWRVGIPPQVDYVEGCG